MSEWVKGHAKRYSNLIVSASGGNARQLLKLLGKKGYVEKSKMEELYEEMTLLDPEERMLRWDLGVDRCDTIVPATRIYATVMHAAGYRHLHIPKVSLLTGILQELADKLTRTR